MTVPFVGGVDKVPVAAAVVAATGCGLLVARPLFPAGTGPLLALFAALMLVGVAWPCREHDAQGPTMAPAAVLGVGLCGFAVARLLGGGEPPVSAVGSVILLNTLAAVAEEAFFRRFLYDRLSVAGPAVAVVGSALLFAVVHLTIWGAWSLPVDLAAGLLLSWQRMASGSWRVPALTHALANVLVVI